MNMSLIYSHSICIFVYVYEKGYIRAKRREKRDRPSLIATSYICIYTI